MNIRKQWTKRILIITAVVTALIALGLAAFTYWARLATETKVHRELVATVRTKEHIQFNDKMHSYVDDVNYTYYRKAQRVERLPGDEEWRLYYEVDHFDLKDEPTSQRLLQDEKKRITATKKLRFTTVGKEQYERLKVGDEITLHYQRLGGSSVEYLMIW